MLDIPGIFPESVELADLTTEVCDGLPSDVEKGLNTSDRYCPWSAKVVAMVGESNDHYYTSYQVAQYLKEMGDKVYPVNPMIQAVDRERSYPSLADVPEPIDIVDVFRTLSIIS